MNDRDKAVLETMPEDQRDEMYALSQGVVGWSDSLQCYVLRSPFLSQRTVLMAGDVFDRLFDTTDAPANG